MGAPRGNTNAAKTHTNAVKPTNKVGRPVASLLDRAKDNVGKHVKVAGLSMDANKKIYTARQKSEKARAASYHANNKAESAAWFSFDLNSKSNQLLFRSLDVMGRAHETDARAKNLKYLNPFTGKPL